MSSDPIVFVIYENEKYRNFWQQPEIMTRISESHFLFRSKSGRNVGMPCRGEPFTLEVLKQQSVMIMSDKTNLVSKLTIHQDLLDFLHGNGGVNLAPPANQTSRLAFRSASEAGSPTRV